MHNLFFKILMIPNNFIDIKYHYHSPIINYYIILRYSTRKTLYNVDIKLLTC